MANNMLAPSWPAQPPPLTSAVFIRLGNAVGIIKTQSADGQQQLVRSISRAAHCPTLRRVAAGVGTRDAQG